MTAVDPDAWRNWSPEAQRKAREIIRQQELDPWRPFYCPDPTCDGRPHVSAAIGRECPSDEYGHWWREDGGKWVCDPEFGCGAEGHPVDNWTFAHARADQRPPPWKQRWRTWAVLSGRGGGKTETGSRLVHRVAEKEPHIILVGATGPDFREIMVEGPSGIMATAPPGKMPEFEPSKKKLTFPSGAIALGFSAEEPDRLRGPQSGFAWADEGAHFDLIEWVWHNLLFGNRLGAPSHILVTSTPLPNTWMRETIGDAKTVVTKVSTYANAYNLDPEFRELILSRYEGTRLGRQELHGEVLEDVEGALWSAAMIHRFDIDTIDHFDTIVVAVDPAGTANKRSDETGIVVVGWVGGIAYVLADYSGKYSPAGWGEKVRWAHEHWSADSVVAEKNYGADMVKYVLDTSSGASLRVKLVDSRRGKALRADPIVAQYEHGNVLHAEGLVKLEDEQLSWVPAQGASPNRLDAAVHGLTSLFRSHTPSAVADPRKLFANRRFPGMRRSA